MCVFFNSFRLKKKFNSFRFFVGKKGPGGARQGAGPAQGAGGEQGEAAAGAQRYDAGAREHQGISQ